MIIINQDKSVICNFNNTVVISKNDDESKIIARLLNCEVTLGIYTNEERAKEVLNELIQRILLTERFKALNSVGGQENMMNDMYDEDKPLFVYEMPME